MSDAHTTAESYSPEIDYSVNPQSGLFLQLRTNSYSFT